MGISKLQWATWKAVEEGQYTRETIEVLEGLQDDVEERLARCWSLKAHLPLMRQILAVEEVKKTIRKSLAITSH
jgi:hypothetical protein